MDDFGLKISLLLEITNKKKILLDTIFNITYNQNCIALGDLDQQSRNLFMQLAKEKQKSIDEVYSLDTVFQRTFDSVKHLLNTELSTDQKAKLAELQTTIDIVMALDKKICELESNNGSLLESKKLDVQKIDVPKVAKNKLLEQYSKQTTAFNQKDLGNKKPKRFVSVDDIYKPFEN